MPAYAYETWTLQILEEKLKKFWKTIETDNGQWVYMLDK